MRSEIHIFIIWSAAAEYAERIISDINSELLIKEVILMQWSCINFTKNISRLYDIDLELAGAKENHVGKGRFHLIVVEDENPIYEKRETSRGEAFVNINIYDLKNKYRGLTGGGHKVHGTDNTSEARHDLWMLLGVTCESFLDKSGWENTLKELNVDLIGSDGWKSLSEVFETLNYLVDYVVIRNFEGFPNRFFLEKHDDIDILVNSLESLPSILNAVKVHNELERVQYQVKIQDELVPFDFRHFGDNYYDLKFEKFILSRKILDAGGFFRPNNEDYFYSLLYHALIHKPFFSADYLSRLQKMATDLGLFRFANEDDAVELLASFFYQNNFSFFEPVDHSVHYRKDVVCRCTKYAPISLLEAFSAVRNADDSSDFLSDLRKVANNEVFNSYLSSGRANVLRPLSKALKGNILEIGAGCGQITRYLGELGAKVLALESNFFQAGIAQSNTADLENVSVLCEQFDLFKTDQKFDVITIIGFLDQPRIFNNQKSESDAILNKAYSLLKPDGKLILATNNKFALSCLAGKSKITRALSRKEIESLLSKFGFQHVEVLAAFPSYKNAVSLVSRQGVLNELFDIAGLVAQNLIDNCDHLPDPFRAGLDLKFPEHDNSELAIDIASSFLIVASLDNKKLIDDSLLAYHYSTNRIPAYCKETIFLFDESIRVEKNRLIKGNDIKNNELIKFICPTSGEYILGKSLLLEFTDILKKDNWTFDQLGQCVSSYLIKLNFLLKKSDLDSISMSPHAVLPGNFFDAIPQNIIIGDDGDVHLIDKEWELVPELELGYLVFRSLLALINSPIIFGASFTGLAVTRYEFISRVFEVIGMRISENDLRRYASLETQIQQTITGSNSENFFEGASNILVAPKFEQLLESRNMKLQELEQLLESRNIKLQELEQRLNNKDLELMEIITSNSWKITLPLRLLKEIMKKFGLFLKLGLSIFNRKK